jgi:hypothetical protein
LVLGSATRHVPQGGIDAEALGIVHVFVAGQTAVNRLPQSGGQRVLGALAGAGVVCSCGKSWSVTGITWDNRPARTGAALDNVPGAVGSNTWIEFDVTTAVTGNGTDSFDLASTAGSSTQMSSPEGPQLPQLVVTTGI